MTIINIMSVNKLDWVSMKKKNKTNDFNKG